MPKVAATTRGGGVMPPSGDDGDEGVAGEGGNTDRAPAAEDQAPEGSSHRAAGEV